MNFVNFLIDMVIGAKDRSEGLMESGASVLDVLVMV